MADNNPNRKPPQFGPVARKRIGIVDELTIYEITDSELEDLARGVGQSLSLNFCIFFLSISVGFLVPLLTVNISSVYVFTVFVVIVVVGISLGSVFLVLWLVKRRSVSDLVRRIRSRLPPEGTQEQLPSAKREEEADQLGSSNCLDGRGHEGRQHDDP